MNVAVTLASAVLVWFGLRRRGKDGPAPAPVKVSASSDLPVGGAA
ncbi:hypothetical protein [Actinomadura sp. B10D3]